MIDITIPLAIFVGVIGAILFYYGFTRPCTICDDIESGQQCWECGKLKREGSSDDV
jgi:hypothetical protein